MQKLVITATIDLPDDVFSAAEILVRMKGAQEALAEVVGEYGSVSSRMITARPPAAEPAKPRKPRKAMESADG